MKRKPNPEWKKATKIKWLCDKNAYKIITIGPKPRLKPSR